MEWSQLLANILTLNQTFETIESQIGKFAEHLRDLEARHYGLGNRVARIEGLIRGMGIQENE